MCARHSRSLKPVDAINYLSTYRLAPFGGSCQCSGIIHDKVYIYYSSVAAGGTLLLYSYIYPRRKRAGGFLST